MKTYLLILGLFNVLAIPAAQTAVLDQSQSMVDTTTGTLAIGGSSDQKLAQVVTAGLAGSLTGIGLPVAGSGTLLLQIEGVSGGLPNGVTLTSQTVAGSGLPGFLTDPIGFRHVDFSNPYFFSPGDHFAIVLSVLNPSTDSFGLLSGPLENPYPGGDAYFDSRPNAPGVWVHMGDFGRADLPFQTFVQPVPEPAPLVLGIAAGLLGIGAGFCRTRRVHPRFK